ncbi:hypothetical protein HPP92_017494 [Vanilla planifolia]|uniref:Protein SCAR n=1 Tax=Vanilla planifolia TaxID=51239 RepID=A0A835QCC1_VANPL|nr:hypothetical protein HPP92_017494 [Vanilla planifolia]
MPTVRYQIRNEYGLADPEVYRGADRDDPEALLEGVAMAGLVGVLRQLGDLAEFAAEVFHDLHEEVLATSARSHGLILRVQQLEAEFPLIEKNLLCQTDHSQCAYSAGVDWHPNLRLDQNLVTQGDMPRFILDSYEECRGPPRLFMLDRFDIAGAGTCLKRYSDPSFFKEKAPDEMLGVDIQREKAAPKFKRKGSHWRSDKMTSPFFAPIMENLQHTISEHVPEKFPRRHTRLKCRKFKVSDISSRKSYMEDLLEEVIDQNDLKDLDSNVVEVLDESVTDSSKLRQEMPFLSSAEKEGTKSTKQEADGKEILEANHMFAGAFQKLYPSSQKANQRLVEPGNNFDLAAYETYINPPTLQQAEQNNLLPDSGFITDDDHDGYRSDDIESELENYVDALNTMESEIETDSESRAISDMAVFHYELEETNPKVNGYLELLTQDSEPGFVGCYDTSINPDKVMDEIPNLSQLNALVDLPYQQLQHRTAFDVTSSSDINQGEIETLESNVGVAILSSACLASPESFDHKTPIAVMFDGTNGEVSCSSMMDSTSSPKGKFEETKTLTGHSIEAFSGNVVSTPKADGHIVSSPPWKTNHVVNHTYKDFPNMPSDSLEEVHSIEKTDDITSATSRKKCDVPFDCSETEDSIVAVKGPFTEFFNNSLLNLMDDEIGKPTGKPELDATDCQPGSIPPSIPIGSTVLKSIDKFSVLENEMQSEDLSKKISYMMNDEDRKELKSGLQLTAEAHEGHLKADEDIASHEFTAHIENFNGNVANGSEKIGSPHGSQDNPWNDHISGVINPDLISDLLHQQGDTATFLSMDIANIFQTPKPVETGLESPAEEVSEVFVKDSLEDLIEDEAICSSEELSPTSSSFSVVLVSSTLHSESVTTGVNNRAEEELMHLESQGNFRNLVSVECEASASPSIPRELQHLSDAEETQESANVEVMEPLQTGGFVNIDAKLLHPEVSESNETNDLKRLNEALELINESTILKNGSSPVLFEESTKDSSSLIGKVVKEDDVVHKAVHMLQCENVSSFNVQLQENMISDDYASCDLKKNIKESSIARDSTSMLSQDKSNGPSSQYEEDEMYVNNILCQSSVLDLSNSSADKLVDVNVDNTNVEMHPSTEEDKVCSRENEQHSHFDSDDIINGNDINCKVLSLLTDVSAGDIQVLDGLVSEDDSLNQHKLDIEVSEFQDDSKSVNAVTEEGIQVFVLPLSESLEASSCSIQLQEDMISENVSLDQLKPETKRPDITSNLTSLEFESNLLVPLCQRGNQEADYIHASSQSTDSNLSYLHENNLIGMAEDEQSPNSKSFMPCVLVDARRPEVQSVSSSVPEAFDETSSLSRVEENIESYDVHLDEGCSNGPTGLKNNLVLEEVLPDPDPDPSLLVHDAFNNECNSPSSKTYEIEQTSLDPSDQLQDVSIASDALASGTPCTSDFIIPAWQINTQENLLAMPCELVSSLQQLEVIEEAPPLPPLPPLQWRMGKTQPGSVFAGGNMISFSMETVSSKFPSNNGDTHMSSFPSLMGEIDEHASPFTSHALEDWIQHVSSCTDDQLTEVLNLSEMSPISVNPNQQPEFEFPEVKTVLTLNLSSTTSKEDVEHSHGNIEIEGENAFSDVMSQHPDLLETRNPLAREQRPELAKLLSGLELERSQEEALMIDRDTVPTLNSFIVMSTTGNGKHQYGYGDYAGYDGQSIQQLNFSASYPVAVHNIPPYSYHMFPREGNPSTTYDIIIPEMECGMPYGKTSSIRNRPRDPLIEAVAAHDKSTLRKISELDLPLTKPKEHERNHLLEQIKNKSFNLKPATSAKPNILKAPATNLKVSAILEKANAIRQEVMKKMMMVGVTQEDLCNFAKSLLLSYWSWTLTAVEIFPQLGKFTNGFDWGRRSGRAVFVGMKARLKLPMHFLLVSVVVALSCQSLDSLEVEGWYLLRFKEGVKVDPYASLTKWGESGVDHCLWYGVGCSDDGRVVSLNLKDLCLEGILVKEIGKLIHLKSLILHNNSLSGTIPKEINQLQKLEVLDLGNNNLSGTFPIDLLRISSLKILVLGNNKFIYESLSPYELSLLSKHQVDEVILRSKSGSFIRNVSYAIAKRILGEKVAQRRKLGSRRTGNVSPASSPSSPPSPAVSPHSSPSPSPNHLTAYVLALTSSSSSAPAKSTGKHSNTHLAIYMSIGAGVLILIALSSMYLLCCRTNRVVSVMPWKTGLSEQLQKAFVTGIPSLKRSELETACEDFSNIICALPGCSFYKGTLSSGVEIAVTSTLIKLAKDWSDQSEALFREKISVLSKVNQKNFMNLIGYCEEEEPFTRMMVYEYAPNGTLFEHLHIKEAEPLDWVARLRIAMGIAYCLEHLQRLEPPMVLRNLNSSTIFLTEDYAAKVSDLSFWQDVKETNLFDDSLDDPDPPLSTKEDVVYKFGIILLEILSGRLPFSKDDGLLVLWASSYLTGKRPLTGIVDQTLKSFCDEDIAALCDVIQTCIKVEPRERPTMAEVAARLKQITGMTPDAVSPKLSPLWWAELEIISCETA